MCGRTACTLNPGNLQRACTYRRKDGDKEEPQWQDAPCGGQYRPSANIPPTAYTPILYTPKSGEGRVLQPMLWGMVPPWFQGPDPTKHGLSTNNARIEGLQESKLYRGSLKNRCIVVCDGFYEWKRDNAVKQPYLVYFSQKEKEIEDVLKYSQDPDSDINEGDWTGPRLTHMAGIYSVWKREDGTPVYNYTVLTRESNQVLSWLHHRMPVFLDEEGANTWLDPTLTPQQALNSLRLPQGDDLAWHPVSVEVGNVKHQDINLIKRTELAKSKKEKGVSKGSMNLMSSWLKRSAPPSKPSEDQPKPKKDKES